MDLALRPQGRWLPWMIGLALLAAGATAAIWVSQARASAPKRMDVPLAGVSVEPEAELETQFEAGCEQPMRQRRFDDALRGCKNFLDRPKLAGRANARLAIAEGLRSEGAAPPASIHHAEQAARLQDPLGELVHAIHILNGDGRAAELSVDDAVRLLGRAQQGGVAAAKAMLEQLDSDQQCRQQARVQLFEQAVFCMRRGELRNALRAQGLREQDSSGDGERDVFAVGHKLPGARQLVVSYMRGAQSRLLQVAELSYRFPAQGSAELALTSLRLRSALQGKYGQAVSESAPLRWRSDDGVDIELRTEPGHNLLLSYRIAERVAVRNEQQRRKVQLAAERLVALTARAL